MARTIRFGSRTFDDPGEQYTAQQIHAALIPIYPELANATIQEGEDGSINFVVKGGTKGS
jgi:hypothetical protein